MANKPKAGGSSEAQSDEKQRELFAKYLSTASAMIVDPNGSSRVRLGHTLAELGAKQNNIYFAGSYDEAIAMIPERRPTIILCEYQMGAFSGLDILQEQRKLRPELTKSIFALITGNTSQSAVAAAAEEDVDTFILKPYTLETLKKTLIKAAISKLYPSNYIVAIEAGKAELFSGRIDAAVKTFESACKLDPKPALALYYKGQAEQFKKALEEANKDYKQGLSFNKIHYKCLVGLYDLMMSKKEYADAYGIVKRVAQYFPANPKRLSQVLRLAIMTESYEDIEGYYRIFTMLENRNEELVRYVCSALIVTGRYYLMGKYNTRAIEVLEKAAVSSAGKTSFLRYIIELLVEFDKHEEAKGVLKRFPPDSQSGPDFLTSGLLAAQKDEAPGVIIQRGRDLIKRGIETSGVYEALIDASIKSGLKDNASELLTRALQKFPDQVKRFERFNELAVGTPQPA